MEGTAYEKFQADDGLFASLISMGISENHAQEALFCTGNDSVEAAISYVYTNLIRESGDCDLPPQAVSEAADEESDNEDVKHFKMTFVVNTSLKMGIGKIAAQVGHACLGLYRDIKIKGDQEEALNQWDYYGEKKIVLKGNSTEHLEELFHKAKELNVACYLVSDAGHTQIPAGSVTVLSVFGDEEQVNSVTGSLGLL